jgi:hypothetical protein
VKVGQQLLLRSQTGWSEVEVIRAEQDGKETILGLRRTEDLPDPRNRVRNSALLFALRTSGRGTKIGPAMAIGMVAVLGFWAYMLLAAYRFSQ